jgi:hypothetical protein
VRLAESRPSLPAATTLPLRSRSCNRSALTDCVALNLTASERDFVARRADPSETAVLTGSVVVVGAGVVVGAASILVLDSLSDGELLGDAGSFLVPTMAALMLTVGLIAAFGPARRGLRIQPTQALRED